MRFISLGSLIATSLLSAACHSMKSVTLEELGGLRPARVWVTRGDQSVVLVEGARLLDNDRLAGFVDGKYQVMPAADVTRVVMRRPAGGRTAALIAAGAVGVTAMVILASGGGGYTDPCSLMSSECNPNGP